MAKTDSRHSAWRGRETPHGTQWTLGVGRGCTLVASPSFTGRWRWWVISESGKVLQNGDAPNLLTAESQSYDWFRMVMA